MSSSTYDARPPALELGEIHVGALAGESPQRRPTIAEDELPAAAPRKRSFDMSLPAPPPPDASWLELKRDAVLSFLDRPVFAKIGVVYIILVIGVGAWFFFMMMGWHSVRPQEAADWTLNLSIQCLCGLFNWPAVITFPWRASNAVHLWGTSRSSAVGHDLYGRPTGAIWFYVPQARRKRLVVLYLLNCVCQYVNQLSRIAYPTYESSNSMPGRVWVNVFFVGSFAFGIWGGVSQLVQETRLHRALTPWFGPGPVDLAKEAVRLKRAGDSFGEIGAKLRAAAEQVHTPWRAAARCRAMRWRGALPCDAMLGLRSCAVAMRCRHAML